MKVIKGNFSGHNKEKESSGQKTNEEIPFIYDEDGNYSTMLLDLIKPYMDADPSVNEAEDMIQMGILAWNLSISQSLGIPEHNEILKSAIEEVGLGKKQVELVRKMEKDKLKKYPDYTKFIENYVIEDDSDNRMKVTLTCTPLADIIMKEIGMEEDEFDEEDFDPDDRDNAQYAEGIVERSAFSLKQKPAFREWAKKLNIILPPTDSVIYLIQELGSGEEPFDWLKKNFKKFMNEELSEVTNDKKKWPKLTYNVFCNFFEAQFHSMIWDTEEEPINKY
jgi:hypothetical protein